MNNSALDSGDAGQLRDLAGRLSRAARTAENTAAATPALAGPLRDFSLDADLLAQKAEELARYADAAAEGRVRLVTGTARLGYGDKTELRVPGEAESLVTSWQAIRNDTGLSREQIDGAEFTFTVITETETGEEEDTPNWFRLATQEPG